MDVHSPLSSPSPGCKPCSHSLGWPLLTRPAQHPWRKYNDISYTRCRPPQVYPATHRCSQQHHTWHRTCHSDFCLAQCRNGWIGTILFHHSSLASEFHCLGGTTIALWLPDAHFANRTASHNQHLWSEGRSHLCNIRKHGLLSCKLFLHVW